MEREQGSTDGRLPRRPYGQTGAELSVIGFGGIVVSGADPSDAAEVVAEAVEKGVNYFDVAPTYGDAEEKLGPTLQPYRGDCFLACKTAERTRAGADADLKRSLDRLRTDHFDLYQLHGLMDVARDVDVAFAPGGAMEVLLEAKKAGTVRFLGFSAHTVAAAVAAMDRYDFDSVLLPVNFACWHAGGFPAQVLSEAQRRRMAILALKALAQDPWPEDVPAAERKRHGKCWYRPVTDRARADLALRWTLSQPVTSAVSPGEADLLRLAVDLAMDYRPLSDDEQQQLGAWAAETTPIFTHPPR